MMAATCPGDQVHCEVHVLGRDKPSAWCAACRMTAPDSTPTVREAIWNAVKSVQNRHDMQAPLNHVNTVEWVDALAPLIAERVQVAEARVARVEALVEDLRQDVEDRREDAPADDGSWPITRAEWVGHIAGLGDALAQLRAALAPETPEAGSAAPCPRDHAGPCFEGRPDLCASILTDAKAAATRDETRNPMSEQMRQVWTVVYDSDTPYMGGTHPPIRMAEQERDRAHANYDLMAVRSARSPKRNLRIETRFVTEWQTTTCSGPDAGATQKGDI